MELRPAPQEFRLGAPLLATGAHGLLLLLLVGAWHRSILAPARLPGTANGTRILTYYSPDGGAPARGALATATTKRSPTPAAKIATSAVAQEQAAGPTAGNGVHQGESGLGEGQVTVAAPQFFPHPRPDLSAIPHGSRGNVILDATIDAQGRIANLVVTTSISPAVDEAVLATVRTWIFTPATKDGVPVASEQELYFHYERG